MTRNLNFRPRLFSDEELDELASKLKIDASLKSISDNLNQASQQQLQKIVTDISAIKETTANPLNNKQLPSSNKKHERR